LDILFTSFCIWLFSYLLNGYWNIQISLAKKLKKEKSLKLQAPSSKLQA